MAQRTAIITENTWKFAAGVPASRTTCGAVPASSVKQKFVDEPGHGKQHHSDQNSVHKTTGQFTAGDESLHIESYFSRTKRVAGW